MPWFVQRISGCTRGKGSVVAVDITEPNVRYVNCETHPPPVDQLNERGSNCRVPSLMSRDRVWCPAPHAPKIVRLWTVKERPTGTVRIEVQPRHSSHTSAAVNPVRDRRPNGAGVVLVRTTEVVNTGPSSRSTNSSASSPKGAECQSGGKFPPALRNTTRPCTSGQARPRCPAHAPTRKPSRLTARCSEPCVEAPHEGIRIPDRASPSHDLERPDAQQTEARL